MRSYHTYISRSSMHSLTIQRTNRGAPLARRKPAEPFFVGRTMKMRRLLIRLVVLLVCFGLVGPFGFDSFAMETTAVSPQKKKSAKKRAPTRRSRSSRVSRGRSRRRNAAVTAPRPAFDKIMSENRALLSESNDAELAAAQIEEGKLRAHIKFLSDDLLEGRGPG